MIQHALQTQQCIPTINYDFHFTERGGIAESIASMISKDVMISKDSRFNY